MSRKVVITAMFAAAVANAQVETTKRSARIQDVVSGQTGNVELRHYTVQNHSASNKFEEGPQAVKSQVRGNFTLKMFDDKLSSTATFAFTNEAHGYGVLKQRDPQLLSELTAFDSDYFSLTPYADLRFRTKTEGNTRSELGMIPMIKHPAIKTALGDLNFSLHAEAEVQFRSRANEGETRFDDRRTGSSEFGLSSSEATEGDKTKENKAAIPEIMYVPTVALNMNRVVSGLSLMTFAEYYNTFEPVKEVTTNVDGTRDSKVTYSPKRQTISYVSAAYKATPKLTISETFQIHHGGFYEERGDNDKALWTNYIKVAYTLY